MKKMWSQWLPMALIVLRDSEDRFKTFETLEPDFSNMARQADGIHDYAFEAVSKVMLYGYNYHHDFIEQVWKGEPSLAEHLRSKFSGYYDRYGSSGVFLAFWSSLSSDRKRELSDWIIKNFEV